MPSVTISSGAGERRAGPGRGNKSNLSGKARGGKRKRSEKWKIWMPKRMRHFTLANLCEFVSRIYIFFTTWIVEEKTMTEKVKGSGQGRDQRGVILYRQFNQTSINNGNASQCQKQSEMAKWNCRSLKHFPFSSKQSPVPVPVPPHATHFRLHYLSLFKQL